MKRFIVGLAMAYSLGCAAAPAAAAASTDRVYVIERVGDRIAPDAIVGAKRAGLACLPNGRIKWSDVGVGGPTDRREFVEDALEDAGLPIATIMSGTPLRRQVRLRGIITDAALDLCARNILGHPSALSGTGKLVVEWRGEGDGDAAPLHHISKVEQDFKGPKAASLGEIGRVLLEEAARDLAEWLRDGTHKD